MNRWTEEEELPSTTILGLKRFIGNALEFFSANRLFKSARDASIREYTYKRKRRERERETRVNQKIELEENHYCCLLINPSY